MQRLTIVIPFRNRHEHLQKFLRHYRRFLPDALFVIVEQTEEGEFNRGKLLNIGALEVEAEHYIFHDVDMLCNYPPDYSFTARPTLFATNVSQFNYQLPFKEYFGGVIGFSRTDYFAINGHSNNFWGWGGEDNELYNHTTACGFKVQHRQHRYYSLPHLKANAAGLDRLKLQQANQPRQANDGLLNTIYNKVASFTGPQTLRILVNIV